MNKESSLEMDDIRQLLFPHNVIRSAQDILIQKIGEVVKTKGALVVHAPTGLGKTAASLSPCLTHIVLPEHKDLSIFFLTSRHTQHKIVIDTLRSINSKFSAGINGASIIGKKHLCLQPGIDKLPSKEFADYCRLLVEEGKCNFYLHLKNGERLSPDAELALDSIKRNYGGIASSENVIDESASHELCPFEMSLFLAKDARVIVADYHHIFNPSIREMILKKTGKNLADSIIIIDEAHNLPSRIKDLSSFFLSNIMIVRAIAEAKKFHYDTVQSILEEIGDVLEKYSKNLSSEEKGVTLNSFTDASKYTDKVFNNEAYIFKKKFIDDISKIKDYDAVIGELFFVGNAIREQQNLSYIGSISEFLSAWQGPDEGFARILSLKRLKDKSIMITLSYRCLDPSIVAAPVINTAYAAVAMSGTLTPTSMYKELLGINASELTLKSPFPVENSLNIIIPKTSTKYELRSPKQYDDIAITLLDILGVVPGCVAIYFPSYYIMGEVSKRFSLKTSKTVFSEQPDMSKAEKQEFLERFCRYKNSGAVLLAVIGGSFSEGIDLPDLLKMVIIVGLPLQRPDLETKSLIEYFDKKFGKGWDYGYLFPAFTKTIQAAGRCIRSEKDKGIIVFLDERYAWNNYYRCFPLSWDIKVSLAYKEIIKNFFSKT
jgi:DNA excision repair protein ERCC-2